jgi:xanthine dehydrogenase YagR molybdenum-binding subunit
MNADPMKAAPVDQPTDTRPAIGEPLPRVDGRLKVTGAATYAAEFDLADVAHAVMVTSTIAKGRVTQFDTAAAERAPGVIAVITAHNAPRLPYREQKSALDPIGERLHVLQDDAVRFNGQPLAVVIAETLEQAEYGASLVRIAYATEPARLDFEASLPEAIVPAAGLLPGASVQADTRRGDPDRALAEAPVRVDARYRLARQQHNPMEPHATIARWDGDRLTLWDKTQWVVTVRDEIAAIFGLTPDRVHVISPFVGGAFGTALRVWPHVTLAALAARQVGRPVKLVLTRRQMYAGTGSRPETWQRVALGATREGTLTAIVHEATGETSMYEQYVERVLQPTAFLHGCANVATRYRLLPLDVHTPVYMRGPGVASGIFALECAVDELACELRMDPVDLRLRNEPARDEHLQRPFSSRATRECYRVGGERFGWASRTPEPRSMRDGRWLIGWGMATAVYHTLQGRASARARVFANGRAIVESAASDMGPGTYTSMTQVASDALGLPPDRVRFVLGDSDFPPAPPHGGSQTMASVGSAVQAACAAVRAKVATLAASPAERATPGRSGPEGGGPKGEPEGGPEQQAWYAEVLTRHGLDVVEAVETVAPSESRLRYSMHAFGAVFADVAVDPDLALVRVRRIVGAYGAGRIVNPRMARSQAIGGMVGGIGMALLEHTVMDRLTGRIVNANLADYLVPVNADVAALEAIFVDEADPHVNPLGVKGLGEIALVGVAPAIANAVFHATGRRVRDLPITIESLL